MTKIYKNAEISLIDRLNSFILITIGLFIIFWVLNFSSFGIEFTDEGYYLNTISSPSSYGVNVPPSMFGFVFNPLYELFQRDIVMLRQAGVLSTYVLAWTLSFMALHSQLNAGRRDFLAVAGIASATACLALVYYAYLLMTPSYNLLAFQSLMAVAIGIMLIRRGAGALGWVIIGIGGWLLFMAKPSSAAMIAIVVPLCLLAMGSFRLKHCLLGAVVAAALLLASSIMIDGSPMVFADRLLKSLALTQTIGAGHGLATALRIDNPNLTSGDLIPITAWSIAIALLTTVGMARWQAAKAVLFAVCLTIAGMVGLYISLGYPIYEAGANRYLFPLALTLGLVAYVSARRSGIRPWKDARSTVVLCWFFAILPHIFIFGSNNNYWESGASAGFFWVLSALCLLGLLFQRRSQPHVTSFLPLAFVFPLLTVVLLDRGVELPYRQPPDIRSFSTPYTLEEGGTLILAKGFAQYLSTAAQTAKEAELSPGGYVIDMTGQSGGLLYALGLNSVGLPWLAGGYPGSNALATEIFATQPCSILAKAWLLDEPQGPRRISPDTLLRFGADFKSDYVLAGSFPVADYAGSRPRGNLLIQDIYKPARTIAEAERACELASKDDS